MHAIHKQEKFNLDTFPCRAITRHRNTIKKFRQEWKILMAEERIRNKKHKFNNELMHEDHVAPLMILRNLILGRDVHTGFTPALDHVQMDNGRAWNNGWHQAYSRLHYALRCHTHMNALTVKCIRLMLSTSYGAVNPKKVHEYLPAPMHFWGYSGLANYFSLVNKTIARHIELEPELRTKLVTYQDVMNFYDGIKKYNVMTEDQFLKRKHGHTRFQAILKQFAHDWITMTGRGKEHILETVTIEETSSLAWLYEPMMYDNPEDSYEAHSVIKIVTKSRRSVIIGEEDKPENQIREKDLIFYLPVKYLWEIDWIEEEPRV